MALADLAKPRAAHRPVLQNAAVVGSLTALAKIAAAAKVAVAARYFGAGDAMDAYLVAFLLPIFFVDTVAGTFTPSLIPGLIRARGLGSKQVQALTQSALFLVLSAMSAVVFVLLLFGTWILPLLGASFSEAKLDLTAALFFSMLVWLPLGACSAAWRAVLNAHDRFMLAVVVQMAAPLLTMVLLVAGAERWGVWTLAAAVVLGSVTEAAVLGVAVRRMGFALRPRWTGWTPEIRSVRGQYAPLLAGTMMVAGCGLFDQAVAASLGSGSVSALSYGQKVAVTLIAVAGTAWGTALLPEFSRFVAQNRWGALRRSVRLHFSLALVLLTAASIVMAWGSADLVRWMFQRGEFGPSEALAVTGIQQVMLMLVPIAVMLTMAQRLATALGASHLVLRAGIAATVANIVADLTLPRWYGVSGVAMAPCVGYAVFLVTLLAFLYFRNRQVFVR